MITVTVILLSLAILIPSASTENGFGIDENGNQVYYVNGTPVKGEYVLGGFVHCFDKQTGAYLGPKDSFTNVGDNTLTLSTAYETALKSLVNSGKKVYAYYTFDDGETFTNAGLSAKPSVESNYGGYSNASVQTYLYTKLSGIFSSNSTLRFQVVTRYSIARLEKRNTSGNNALLLTSSSGTAAHSYLNVTANTPANTEIVVEAEYKLGKGYSAKSTSLFQLIDRNNIDAVNAGYNDKNYMPALLQVNSEGGVTLATDSSKLVALLTENEFTRLSVAIHPSTNTIDVYVNGLLVVDEATFLPSDSYNATNFAIDEFRTVQFNTVLDAGSMLIDNVAIYASNKPVSTITATPKNGAYLYGTTLHYYQNNLLCLGNQIVNGTFAGIKLNNKFINFGNASGNGAAYLGNTYTVTVNGNVTETAMSAGNVFTAPDAPSTTAGAFGAWKVTDSTGTVFLAPGQMKVYRLR